MFWRDEPPWYRTFFCYVLRNASKLWARCIRSCNDRDDSAILPQSGPKGGGGWHIWHCRAYKRSRQGVIRVPKLVCMTRPEVSVLWRSRLSNSIHNEATGRQQCAYVGYNQTVTESEAFIWWKLQSFVSFFEGAVFMLRLSTKNGPDRKQFWKYWHPLPALYATAAISIPINVRNVKSSRFVCSWSLDRRNCHIRLISSSFFFTDTWKIDNLHSEIKFWQKSDEDVRSDCLCTSYVWLRSTLCWSQTQHPT